MIVFEKQLSINDLLLSYNNNTVTFKQSSTTLTASKATVNFSGLVFTLYPDPNGKFYFNFKYAISTLINNNRNFKDEAVFGSAQKLNWTNEIYKLSAVTYRIFYTDLTQDETIVNYHFLSAYVNLQNYRTLYPNYPFLATTQMLLKPIPYLKYWSGLPFDFTYYNGLLNNIVINEITSEGVPICQKYQWGVDNFYTSIGTINGFLGDNIDLIYKRSTNINLANSIQIDDIISVLDWKFKVYNSLTDLTQQVVGTSIVQVGTPVTPITGVDITSCFALTNVLITPTVITNTNRVNRIILPTAIELQDGYNHLEIGGNYFYIEQLSQYCNGHYIKWLNSLGGWNYWLFDKGNDTLTTKDLGTIYNDYNDIVDTVSPYVAIGKTSENNIAVNQANITPNELLILNDLPDSPKVYLFQGLPNNWLEVTIKSSSFRVANSKEKMTNFNFTIELPTNVTKTL
jgi:hypothetical protein